MSTSKISSGNPSLNAGHPETSGSEMLKPLFDRLEDELLDLRAILAVAYVAVNDAHELGHGEAPGAREYFYDENGASRLLRLDWLAIENTVRSSIDRVCERAEMVPLDGPYHDDLLTVSEAVRGWTRHIRFAQARISDSDQVCLAQMLKLVLREVERLTLTFPSIAKASAASYEEVAH